MNQLARITIEMEIRDEAALRLHAKAQAESEGITDWSDDAPLEDCVRMLFDPGVSPPGTEITDSSAELICARHVFGTCNCVDQDA